MSEPSYTAILSPAAREQLDDIRAEQPTLWPLFLEHLAKLEMNPTRISRPAPPEFPANAQVYDFFQGTLHCAITFQYGADEETLIILGMHAIGHA